MDRTAGDVNARFAAEQDYIQRFTAFLKSQSSLRDEEVGDVSRILRTYGLPELPTRGDWARRHEPYTSAEAETLIGTIKRIEPEVRDAADKAQLDLDGLEVPEGLGQVDVRSPIGEWLEFLLQALAHDQSPRAIEAARRDALGQQDQAVREYGADADVLSESDIDYAFRSALFLLADRRAGQLAYAVKRLAEFELVGRMVAPDAELNVLRQGFLLLMTAFDAAIFDSARVALQNDFFRRIAVFGPREKVELQHLAQHASWDDFRDHVIDAQLRPRYLRDMLHILHGAGVQCVDIQRGDRFADLVELVLRRNVHVHNRGIVDSRYLEPDTKGIARFNIYALAEGVVAAIDATYWEKANRLCAACVAGVAAWAG